MAVVTAPVDTDALLQSHLHAARDGDRDAYARIVALCQNSITTIALAIVRDVPASEDIAQEAFLSAWQNLQRLQNPASFLPWLRQITRNLAHDHLRTHRRRPPAVDDAEAVIESVADPSPEPRPQPPPARCRTSRDRGRADRRPARRKSRDPAAVLPRGSAIEAGRGPARPQ